ncbi:cytochrome c oxidase subunit II (plasmid) [Nitrobacter sp. NHB1]|uniref:cytochrome c oxidase subunit II n=1 Tax=Nitrobacter sp. NHB1 TaxID=3119830 RepID=UPI003000DE30
MSSIFMPEAASQQAVRTDQIYFVLLTFSGFIVLLVAALILVFSIRYRRGSKAKRGALPKVMSREFEIGWTSATLFLALFIFWWVSSTHLSALAAPKNALEIHVVAKQWMWKTQHSNGAREINELHVPLDTPVRLVMTSEDVIHSFFVPAFRMKKDVLPGRYTETWFRATKPGVFHLFCAEYCGSEHSRMTGRIVVVQKDAYARWLAAQPEGDGLAKTGEAVFRARGCSGCHSQTSKVHAPNLNGLYGRKVQLAGGRTVTADEAYLRDSMLMPRRDVVAGFEPIMPSYAGILTDGEIISLTAYIRSLSGKGANSR